MYYCIYVVAYLLISNEEVFYAKSKPHKNLYSQRIQSGIYLKIVNVEED